MKKVVIPCGQKTRLRLQIRVSKGRGQQEMRLAGGFVNCPEPELDPRSRRMAIE